MFTPNYNNFAKLNDFNNLNQSQNIYPNYYPKYNNFNQYNLNKNNNYLNNQKIIELEKKLIE